MSMIDELCKLHYEHTVGGNVTGGNLAKDLADFIEAYENGVSSDPDRDAVIRNQDTKIEALIARCDAARNEARIAEESLATVVAQREDFRRRYFDACEAANVNARSFLRSTEQHIVHCEAIIKFRRTGKLSDADVRAVGLDVI